MWKDVAGFVPQIFSCVNIRITLVQRWIPLSQHIVSIQAGVIMQHVAQVQELSAYPPNDNSWEQVQPGPLPYSNSVALDEVDRIVRRHHELASNSLPVPEPESAPHPQSQRNTLSLVPTVNTPPVSDTTRVFKLEFALSTLDVLIIKSLQLVFTRPSAPDNPTQVVEVHDIQLPSHMTVTAIQNTIGKLHVKSYDA